MVDSGKLLKNANQGESNKNNKGPQVYSGKLIKTFTNITEDALNHDTLGNGL